MFLSAVAAAALLNVSGAQAQTGAALTGTVTSAEEGAMEGVVITAKRDGANMAISVVSDAQGRYSFPADRLEPGRYTIRIRATGYIPDGRPAAEVAPGRTTTLDLNLKRTENLAPQLTNTEWLMSMPGSDEDKEFLSGCVNCHSLQRPLTSAFTAEEFMEIIPRMGTYSPGSMVDRPQKLLPGPRGNRGMTDPEGVRKAAEYLASVNLSKNETWNYKFQTLPRPTGRGTKVIITTYDLPRREAMPHDVIVVNGKAYYSDFGSQYIGEMDLKTGKVVDYPVPLMKPEQPRGLLAVKADRDGNIWGSGMFQGGIAMLDAKTKEVKTFKVPDQWQGPNTQESMISPTNLHVDGFVWTNNQEDHSILRMNVKTGEWENLGVLRDAQGRVINGYEIPSDSQNNLWVLEFGNTHIARIDAKTKEYKVWTTPTPRARPRRGHFDENGILWFAEYGANQVGSIDPKTEKITEYKMPFPWHLPYDAQADRNGHVWTASMLSDRLVRLDPKTGETVTYLFPFSTNVRRMFVEQETGHIWIGNNHGAQIYKIEPLD